MNAQRGSIELIFGPMFSGKSSELMRKIKRYQHAGKNCLVVNFKHDNRYESGEVIVNHDKNTLPAKKIQKIEEIQSIYKNYDVIAIDEGQFFSDVVELSELMANDNKIVIISALDGTFQRQPFGNILNLIPKAEKVKKLSAVCVFCFNSAHFSKRICDNQVTLIIQDIELIGSDDIYKPVCRTCFQIDQPTKQAQNQSQNKVLKQLDKTPIKRIPFAQIQIENQEPKIIKI